MSVRLEVSGHADVPPEQVWNTLIDWVGQSRWIPLTTVRVRTAHDTGVGVRCDALSGFWLGSVPFGLLDRFVVTTWQPPTDEPGELEILHLGPYFTGPGVFRLTRRADGGTDIACTELFELPGGAPAESLARLTLPLMRVAFGRSLAQLAAVASR